MYEGGGGGAGARNNFNVDDGITVGNPGGGLVYIHVKNTVVLGDSASIDASGADGFVFSYPDGGGGGL